MEDSENEEQDVDEEKRQEAKMKRAEEKLTKLRLEFHLRTVSFSKDASFDIYFRDEDGRFLYSRECGAPYVQEGKLGVFLFDEMYVEMSRSFALVLTQFWRRQQEMHLLSNIRIRNN